jgi:hypothetical protein
MHFNFVFVTEFVLKFETPKVDNSERERDALIKEYISAVFQGFEHFCTSLP